MEQHICFEKQRYLIVRSILDMQILSFLKSYYQICKDIGKFSSDRQCPLSLSLGHDPAFDALLNSLCPNISSLIGAKLAPTYSYTRIYGRGDSLRKHLDRPACEISATICVEIPSGQLPSPLFLQMNNSEVIEVT